MPSLFPPRRNQVSNNSNSNNTNGTPPSQPSSSHSNSNGHFNSIPSPVASTSLPSSTSASSVPPTLANWRAYSDVSAREKTAHQKMQEELTKGRPWIRTTQLPQYPHRGHSNTPGQSFSSSSQSAFSPTGAFSPSAAFSPTSTFATSPTTNSDFSHSHKPSFGDLVYQSPRMNRQTPFSSSHPYSKSGNSSSNSSSEGVSYNSPSTSTPAMQLPYPSHSQRVQVSTAPHGQSQYQPVSSFHIPEQAPPPGLKREPTMEITMTGSKKSKWQQNLSKRQGGMLAMGIPSPPVTPTSMDLSRTMSNPESRPRQGEVVNGQDWMPPAPGTPPKAPLPPLPARRSHQASSSFSILQQSPSLMGIAVGKSENDSYASRPNLSHSPPPRSDSLERYRKGPGPVRVAETLPAANGKRNVGGLRYSTSLGFEATGLDREAGASQDSAASVPFREGRERGTSFSRSRSPFTGHGNPSNSSTVSGHSIGHAYSSSACSSVSSAESFESADSTTPTKSGALPGLGTVSPVRGVPTGVDKGKGKAPLKRARDVADDDLAKWDHSVSTTNPASGGDDLRRGVLRSMASRDSTWEKDAATADSSITSSSAPSRITTPASSMASLTNNAFPVPPGPNPDAPHEDATAAHFPYHHHHSASTPSSATRPQNIASKASSMSLGGLVERSQRKAAERERVFDGQGASRGAPGSRPQSPRSTSAPSIPRAPIIEVRPSATAEEEEEGLGSRSHTPKPYPKAMTTSRPDPPWVNDDIRSKSPPLGKSESNHPNRVKWAFGGAKGKPARKGRTQSDGEEGKLKDWEKLQGNVQGRKSEDNSTCKGKGTQRRASLEDDSPSTSNSRLAPSLSVYPPSTPNSVSSHSTFPNSPASSHFSHTPETPPLSAKDKERYALHPDIYPGSKQAKVLGMEPFDPSATSQFTVVEQGSLPSATPSRRRSRKKNKGTGDSVGSRSSLNGLEGAGWQVSRRDEDGAISVIDEHGRILKERPRGHGRSGSSGSYASIAPSSSMSISVTDLSSEMLDGKAIAPGAQMGMNTVIGNWDNFSGRGKIEEITPWAFGETDPAPAIEHTVERPLSPSKRPKGSLPLSFGKMRDRKVSPATTGFARSPSTDPSLSRARDDSISELERESLDSPTVKSAPPSKAKGLFGMIQKKASRRNLTDDVPSDAGTSGGSRSTSNPEGSSWLGKKGRKVSKERLNPTYWSSQPSDFISQKELLSGEYDMSGIVSPEALQSYQAYLAQRNGSVASSDASTTISGLGLHSTTWAHMPTFSRPKAPISDGSSPSSTSGFQSRKGSIVDSLLGSTPSASSFTFRSGPRKDSTFTLGVGSGNERRPSTAGSHKENAAGWTAPESWAVQGEANAGDAQIHATSVEEDDLIEELRLRKAKENRNASMSMSRIDNKGDTKTEGNKGKERKYYLRIFRPDCTMTTVQTTLMATVADIQVIIGRKLLIAPNSGHRIYILERGLERLLAPTEKPLLIQNRRLEQAGYEPADRLEELGLEDHSILCRFVFKPEVTLSFVPTQEAPHIPLEQVDLEGKCVETVPIYLYGQAPSLVYVNLSKNPRVDLPSDWVQACDRLRELKLDYNGMKRIPPSLQHARALTHLHVNGNGISDLSSSPLPALKTLSTLALNSNRLCVLPEFFSDMTCLRVLNISNNRFTELPRVICRVPSLVDLDVSFNSISELPEDIGKLTQLRSLIILANKISILPGTVKRLIQLKEFDCRWNTIHSLSPLSSLPSLAVLQADNNNTALLEVDLPRMIKLSARHSSLTQLQLASTGETLRELDLGWSKLSSFDPKLFDHMLALEKLVLDNNLLSCLPSEVGRLKKLRHLSLKGNHLKDFPDVFAGLKQLSVLDLSSNTLQSLPSSIWYCPSLETVLLSSNVLREWPEVPSERDPPLSDSLRKLYLADNHLGENPPPLDSFPNLRILNLSYNNLSDVPSIRHNLLLEELYLSGNMLKSLPSEEFDKQKRLIVLHLNGNQLHDLPVELGNSKGLQVLDVGSNKLRYNIANLKYDWNWNWNTELRFLNLSGNRRFEIKSESRANVPPIFPAKEGVPRQGSLTTFHALKKLRVLGLMDVTMTEPAFPDEGEDRRVRTSLSEINDMAYGIADSLGRVGHLSLADMVVPRFRTSKEEALFGIFDAVPVHLGGGRLIKYMLDCYAAALSSELAHLKTNEGPVDALRRSFLKTNRDYGNILVPRGAEGGRKDSAASLAHAGMSPGNSSTPNPSHLRCGASGIVIYIKGKTMYVAHCGTSLVVLSRRGGSPELLTQKHTPFRPTEAARIHRSGGWVSPRGVVNDTPGINVSRSFGYYHVHPAVNAGPDIQQIELNQQCEFVIVASRALWNYITYQAAVDFARADRKHPMASAAKIRDLAVSYGCESPLMVMVIVVGDLFKEKDSRLAIPSEPTFFSDNPQRRRVNPSNDRLVNQLDEEVRPPKGLVAVVFTDIKSSTRLWAEETTAMRTAVQLHNTLMRRHLRAMRGFEVKTEGDAFMATFYSMPSALLWCIMMQLELLKAEWPPQILNHPDAKQVLGPKGEVLYRGLTVRMGIHWGSPLCEDDPVVKRMDYWGPIVNLAARVSGSATAGLINLSESALADLRTYPLNDPVSSPTGTPRQSMTKESRTLNHYDRMDIEGLKAIGFGLHELGWCKLKGLETPEYMSIAYPKDLVARLASVEMEGEVNPEEEVLFEPGDKTFKIEEIVALGKLCMRVEKVVGWLTRNSDDEPSSNNMDRTKSLSLRATSLLSASHLNEDLDPPQVSSSSHRTFQPFEPAELSLMTLPIHPSATDQDMVVMFEQFLLRLENALDAFALHQTKTKQTSDAQKALETVLGSGPQSILEAITQFAGALGISGLDTTQMGKRDSQPAMPSFINSISAIPPSTLIQKPPSVTTSSVGEGWVDDLEEAVADSEVDSISSVAPEEVLA